MSVFWRHPLALVYLQTDRLMVLQVFVKFFSGLIYSQTSLFCNPPILCLFSLFLDCKWINDLLLLFLSPNFFLTRHFQEISFIICCCFLYVEPIIQGGDGSWKLVPATVTTIFWFWSKAFSVDVPSVASSGMWFCYATLCTSQIRKTPLKQILSVCNENNYNSNSK